MTNTSFSKISDLILPGKDRSSGQSPDRAPNPGAVRQFEQLLKTVKDRDSGTVRPQSKPPTRRDDRTRPDVGSVDRRPVADRPSLERRDNDRPERVDRDVVERDDVDRADETDHNDEAEAVNRPDDAEVETGAAEDENGAEDTSDDTTESHTDQDGDEDGGDKTASEEESGQQQSTQVELGANLQNTDEAIDLSAVNEDPTDAEVTDEPVASVAGPATTDGGKTSKQPPVTSTEASPDEVDDVIAATATATATAAAALTGQTQAAGPVGTDEITVEAETVETVAPAAADSESAADPVVDTDVVPVDTENADSEQTEEVEAPTAEAENDTDAQDAEGGTQPESGTEQTTDDGEQAPQQSAIATSPSGASNNAASSAAAVGSTSQAVGETTTRSSVAAAAAQTAETAAVADGEDGDILWRQVRRAIGSMRTTAAGDQQMTIRLRPAELGSVMIRVTTGEAGTTVALVAESAAAANQLNQQRQQLISELEDGGLSEVAVDVGTNEDQQNQTEESEGDGEQSDGSGQGSSTLASQDAEPLDRFQIRRNGGASAGLIDLDL